jgi:sugar lactone lactonase YvrE
MISSQTRLPLAGRRARIVLGLLVGALVAISAAAQRPSILSISPSTVPITGGEIVINGTHLAGGLVEVDHQAITPLAASDTEIRLRVTPHDNGYALVSVTTTEGDAYGEFLYVPPALETLPPGYITTVAGVGTELRLYRPAVTASIGAGGVAVTRTGDILYAYPPQDRVLRIGKDGILYPFAGDGYFLSTEPGDGGPATEAHIQFCRRVAVDGEDNAFIADEGSRVRRVDARSGIITTVAGTGQRGFGGDGGPATEAWLSLPSHIAVEPDGTLYILDAGNHRIRRVGTDGVIRTIAGTGVCGYSGDGGPATDAQIEAGFVFAGGQPDADSGDVAVDPGRSLYLAEQHSNRIRKIDLRTGIISTFATSDSTGTPLWNPQGLTVDSGGNLYVGTPGSILKLRSDGTLAMQWGTPIDPEQGAKPPFSDDGSPLDNLKLGFPVGLAIESNGNVVYSDYYIFRVKRLNLLENRLETVAGVGPGAFGVPGPALGAFLDGPLGDIALLPQGDLLFSSCVTLAIYRIDPMGWVTRFAGTGMFFGGPHGSQALEFGVGGVVDMEVSRSGDVYYTNTGAVGRIDATGIEHHVAGWGSGFSGDGGPATKAAVEQPSGLALDRDGNVLIADTNNNRIRRVDAKTGIITTIAGSGPGNGGEGYGRGSYCGDGGPALEACLNTPFGVAAASDGSVFVSDFANWRLRKIDPAGVITTYFEDRTFKLHIDSADSLFASTNQTILKFRPDGTPDRIAGGEEEGFSGDGGPATKALIFTASMSAAGIAVDRSGNLLFHDVRNQRIRAVRFGGVLAPPGSRVSALSGGEQSAAPLQAFGAPLVAVVHDEKGQPLPSVRVDFSAPTSGARCVFEDGSATASAVTNRVGQASVRCTATGVDGAFEVRAVPLVSAELPSPRPATFSLHVDCSACRQVRKRLSR